jgi:hypothetical protein
MKITTKLNPINPNLRQITFDVGKDALYAYTELPLAASAVDCIQKTIPKRNRPVRPVHDGNGLAVRTKDLITLGTALSFELSVHPLPCETDDEMAKNVCDALAMLGTRSRTPNPILECPATVGTPCARKSTVCFGEVL